MKRFFLALFCCLYAFSAKADFNCSNKPTCTSLGYIKESSAKCYGQSMLRCPFDDTYVFCGDDTVDLNCRAGNYFNPAEKSCYTNGTVSDFVFIKYNDIQTKAYVFSLSQKNTGVFDSYDEALEDNLAHLLTREILEILRGTNVMTSSVLGDCIRIRNGKTNEIVRPDGSIVSESSFSSVCHSAVTSYYYTKANLY